MTKLMQSAKSKMVDHFFPFFPPLGLFGFLAEGGLGEGVVTCSGSKAANLAASSANCFCLSVSRRANKSSLNVSTSTWLLIVLTVVAFS